MPNNDYILRSDALMAIQECFDKELEFSYDNAQSCMNRIKAIPAADVEQVVRCENCQFFEIVEYWPDGTKKVCQLLKRQVQENSFCCWGMKKEAEDAEIH